MSRMGLSLLLLIVMLINQSINAQNYLPKPREFTSCPAGYTYQSVGSNNVADLGTFPATSQTLASYVMTSLFNGTNGMVLNQVSLGITDNSQLTTTVLLRLAVFRVTNELSTSPQLVMLGQTAEIQLFATTPDIIYGNLLQNVTLQTGLYAMGVWSNSAIRTGVGSTVGVTFRNVPYYYYNSIGLAGLSVTNSYTYGARALKGHGCMPSTNPYTDPTNRLVNFCAYLQTTVPALTSTSYSYQYATRTVTYSLGGVLAVSTTDIGTSTNGAWGRAKAGYATMTSRSTSEYYYQSFGQQVDSLVLGAGSFQQYDQQFYQDINGPRVDSQGISFSSSSGAQVIVSYRNNSYQLTRYRNGVPETFTAVMSGFSTSDTVQTTCAPPSSYTPDTMTCPSGSLPVEVGDSNMTNAQYLYSTATSYIYANYMYTRTFTAWTPQTTLNQLSLVVWGNAGIVARIRMGVFSAEAGNFPTLTLLTQTREIELKNADRQVLRINLQTPLELEQGRNYTIGFMTDTSLYAPYGYWVSAPMYYNLGYSRFMTASGFPQTVSTVTTSSITAMGGSGCARQQTTRRVSFCAAFVYAGYTSTYSGVLDVLATAQNSALGSYNLVVGGSGIYNQTYAPGSASNRLLPFLVNNYNHPANWRLYNQPTTAGRHVDSNGIAVIVHAPTGFSGGISTFYDPVSASWEFMERTQTMSSSTISTGVILISEMSIADYNGGQLPTCNPPVKPLNTVSPASVARFVCPNNENSISEVFGSASVADYPVNADDTTIEANRIYTTQFVATSTSTVRQFAIGILRNTNRAGPILVRLGLYNAATNTLMGQAAQLSLNQAVDQLIVMNIPTPVTVTAGQSYYIALVSSLPLEVATSATADSPSMAFTFSSTGLPTAFASSGNAVSVSIAVYTCSTSTHSFCAYYQYYDLSLGRSLSYFYQGLLQAEGTATDGYGTYTTVYAASGRLTQYSRLTSSVSSVVTVYTFFQVPGDEAKLYTSSTNGRPLNGQGIRLLISTGTESIVNFNISNNMMDESFQDTNLDTFLRYSQFTFTRLANDVPVPACGLGSVPTTPLVPVPDVTCPAGQTNVIHGSADVEDYEYPRDTYAVSSGQAVFNRFMTGSQATMIHHLKAGISQNRNLVNQIRLALYSSNFTFLASTETISLNNPSFGIATGALSRPQYLAPQTVYYIGIHSLNAISTGYGNQEATSFMIPFRTGAWPATLDRDNAQYNNNRPLAAHGCTTPVQVVPVPSSTAAPGQVSSSSSTVDPAQSSTAPAATSSPVQPPASSTAAANVVDVSTSSDGLSKGQVAGIVIGCVLATNLLVFACLWLMCFGCGAASAKRASGDQVESSRVA